MANTYKNIVITPNRDTDAANVPSIRFSGGDGTSNTDINVRVYTTQSGTLSFEGSAGQLFSVTNDLTGSIFSVNDVSGIPSIEVFANGQISFAPYGGNVVFGSTSSISNPYFNSDINFTNAGVTRFISTPANNSLTLRFGTTGQSGYGTGSMALSVQGGGYVRVDYSGGGTYQYDPYGSYWHMGYSGITFNNSGGNAAASPVTFQGVNYVNATTSFRAPIFYDSDNTAYYMDLNTTSRLNALQFANGATSGPYFYYGNNQQNLYLRGSSGADIGVSFFDSSNTWRAQLYASATAYGFLASNWGLWDLQKVSTGRLYLNNQTTYYIDTNEIYYNRVYGVTDIRSPIFYDNNDTAYYVDAASTSKLSILNLASYGYVAGTTIHGQSFFQWDAATYRNPADHTPSFLIRQDNVTTTINGFKPALALYNNNGGDQTTVGLSFASSESATGTPNSVTLAGIVAKKDIAGVSNGWTSGSLYFFVKELGTRRDGMFIHNTGYVQSDYSFRAPIFYDSADTTYYIDPASTADAALRMRGGAYFGPNTSWSEYLYVGGNGRVGTSATVAVTNGNLHLDSKDGNATYLNWYSQGNVWTGTSTFLGLGNSSASHRLHVHGTGLATTDFRAPIFYDSDNTAYYVDPANSNTSLQIAGTIEQGNNIARPNIEWQAAGASTGMVIFSLPGVTPTNYGMVHMVFDIYEYVAGGRIATVIVGGHNWSGNWHLTGCQVIGNLDKTVRLGVKDSKFCIVFGGAASAWDYGTIRLRKIHNGGFYNNIMDLGGPYTVVQTATESFTTVTADLRQLRTPGTFQADGDIRTPIFYDSNNTAFYVDPASGSSIKRLFVDITNVDPTEVSGAALGNIYEPSTGWSAPGIAFGTGTGSHGAIGYNSGLMYFATENGSDNTLNSRMTLTNAGILTVNGDVRTPVFYDLDNTAYYTNPATTSNMNTVQAVDAFRSNRFEDLDGNFFFREGALSGVTRHLNLSDTDNDPSTMSSDVGISWGARSDNNPYYMIWTSNYNNGISTHSRLRLGWHTGMEIGASPNYGGVRFFDNSPGISGATEIMSIGKIDAHVRVINNLYSKIYYDIDNTAYYTDPASTSNLNGLTVAAITVAATITGSIQYVTAGQPPNTDSYMNFRVMRNNNSTSSNDGMYIGYSNSNSGVTRIFGGGIATGEMTKYSDRTEEPGSFRAPIFYDVNNTAYYTDPASTSVLNNLTASNINVTNINVTNLNASTIGWNSTVSQFGQRSAYINEFVDILYQADKRFTVTNGSANYFDGDFGSSGGIPVSTTRVININIAGQAGIPANGITYCQGFILVSFYYTDNLYSSLSLRVRNYLGVWTNAAAPTDISTSASLKVMAFTVPIGNYLTDIELTVVTDATNAVLLSSINYYSTRWTTETELPYASKYLSSNYMFGNFGVKNNTGGINNLLSGTASSYLSAIGGSVGIGNAAPAHKLDVTGTAYASADVRAPIFYDSGNTGYYVDPAGATNLFNLYIQGGVANPIASAQYYDAAIEVREFAFGGAQTDSWSYAPRIGFHWSGRVAAQIGMNSSARISILNSDASGYAQLQSSNFYSPIFYDSDNTTYYVDPATGTNLNGTLINNAGTAMTGGWNRSILLNAMFPVIVFNSNNTKYSGIGVDYSAANAGFYFWVNGNSTDINNGSATVAMHINTGNFVAAAGSFRAPIFYDSNNTAYYTYPSSTSNLNGLTVAATITGTITNSTQLGGKTEANLNVNSAATFTSTSQNSQFNSLGIGTAASGTAGEIRANNNITAYYSSDIRLKTNIKPIENSLFKLQQINGMTFDWTDEEIERRGGEDGYFVRKHDVGVIAQEVEIVLPEIVAERLDGYKAVKYEMIVPLLIEAIKELKAELDMIKEKIK